MSMTENFSKKKDDEEVDSPGPLDTSQGSKLVENGTEPRTDESFAGGGQ